MICQINDVDIWGENMKNSVNEIMDLIDNLSMEEKRIIYKRMEKDINSRLFEIFERVSERAEKEPLNLEEITEEVEKVRGQNYGKA